MLSAILVPYGIFIVKKDDETQNFEDITNNIVYFKKFDEEEIPSIMYELRQDANEKKEELKNALIEEIKELKETNENKEDLEEKDEKDEKDEEIANLESLKILNLEELESITFEGSKIKAENDAIRNVMYELGVQYGVFEDLEDDFLNKMNEWTVQYTKMMMKRSSQAKDKLIVQTVNALDNLDETLNLFSERLREWYSLYFPEMDNIVKKQDAYVQLVSEYGFRENYTRTRLKEEMPQNLARTLSVAAKKSMGAEISEVDLQIIKSLANEIHNLYKYREELLAYLDNSMTEVAPNLTKIAGPSIGARLISLAGGMDRLSILPGSTIQVIGAEKALFAHLRERADSPKHGIIFQHPYIQGATGWTRGKISRAIACKMSIAIKADVSGNYIADDLSEQIDKKVADIKTRFPKPPIKKKSKRPQGKGRPGKPGDRRPQGKGKPQRRDGNKDGRDRGDRNDKKDGRDGRDRRDRRDNRDNKNRDSRNRPDNKNKNNDKNMNKGGKGKNNQGQAGKGEKRKVERVVIGKTSSKINK
ncbi:Pre-mRNA processing ribonucleoprotein [Methanococcus voltae]|jgi:nucleolar protein 56|uniref:Pre-mRNA processing ribonucleoprotein, binding domain protein n=1 Tax=Methanococcus voltae (strain ATCC BAA-1334 / A3) TaxID=456320 RepID=D7DTQ2_METV3|nr:Pre-mRNA processing ribonucleoprotein [Methanococcus voltae]MCS3901366.1 nucleolar protein 56 [Methanococcus voltae]